MFDYKEWYQKNKEKRKAYQRKWEAEHKEQRRGRQQRDKAHRIEWGKIYRRKLKLEGLTYYSGGTLKCARCNIEDINTLCLDHIEGGGYKHKQLGLPRAGYSLYRRLKKIGYPEGYQVLCANCNLKKLIEEGK